MMVDFSGLVILVGNYGSGKTEVAVNLALHQCRAGKKVQIADLDLVNPYFRTREADELLTGWGVEVIVPEKRLKHADLPILVPQIGGMIRAPRDLAILDVGGNNVGAMVLAALSDHLAGQAVQMLQVVNPYRPFTETAAGCQKIRREIEAAAGLTVTGLIGNPNLMNETTLENIRSGYRFLMDLSEISELPLESLAVAQEFVPDLEKIGIICPILPLQRQLVFPWQNKRAPAAPVFKALG